MWIFSLKYLNNKLLLGNSLPYSTPPPPPNTLEHSRLKDIFKETHTGLTLSKEQIKADKQKKDVKTWHRYFKVKN